MNNQNNPKNNPEAMAGAKPSGRPNYGSGLLPLDLVEKLIRDAKVRVATLTRSFYFFFHFYFAHYVTFPTAEFQKEIFRLIEKSDREDLFIVAFRGSGKSTIMTTVYPIWAILGRQQKKFVVIISQTRNQARGQMANLKAELENNELLKNDLGPFEEEADEWGLYSMVFKDSGARILAASTEQSIRGIRHRQWRPDLIILDDVEDINSTKTYESRQRLDDWFHGDVVPLGDPQRTRLIVVGNLLHEDSLMMRIKRKVEAGRGGIFRMYALFDEQGNVRWPGKYPTPESIEKERIKHGDVAFEREFNLKILPADDQVVRPEWISTYGALPAAQPSKIIIGVDLAISDKSTADHTVILAGAIYGHGRQAKAYFLPHPVNEKLSFPATIEKIKEMHREHKGSCPLVEILIEDVGYQRAVVQALEQENLPVKGIKVTSDKRARLAAVSNLIKNSQAVFPAKGGEAQIRQIVGFGTERYDDLADATTLILLDVLNEKDGDTVKKETILGNVTKEDNLYEGRFVIGVDVLEGRLYCVIGNRQGLVWYGIFNSYEPDPPRGIPLEGSLEYLLKKFDSVVVISQSADIVSVERLRSRYPGRVSWCRYAADDSVATSDWDKKDKRGNFTVDRNNMIRLLSGEFREKNILLYNGKLNDWHDYWLHWSHIYQVKEEDGMGNERHIWRRFDNDSWINATISWRTGLGQVQRGFIAMPEPELKPNSYHVDPDGMARFDPEKLLQLEPDWYYREQEEGEDDEEND